MTYQVSSAWINETLNKRASPLRQFFVGSNDLSQHVIKWPSVSYSIDDIRPRNVSIQLKNDFNAHIYHQDKTLLVNTCQLRIGYTIAGSAEMVTVMAGELRSINFDKGKVVLGITDRFYPLTRRTIGTDDSPVDYSGSDYLPSDIAWYAMTSHGGLSGITSINNPDIDYPSWKLWSDTSSSDSEYMRSILKGQKCIEVLRKLSRLTETSIYIHDNKIFFKRFSLADSNATQIDENMGIATLRVDRDTIINRQKISAGYSPTSNYHTITIISADTASVNSYGLFEGIEEDRDIWFVNSVSAQVSAQRKVTLNKHPRESLSLNTSLVGLHRQIGETISYVSSDYYYSNIMRVKGYHLDMNTGEMGFDLDRSLITNAFILDLSVLDGSDVLI